MCKLILAALAITTLLAGCLATAGPSREAERLKAKAYCDELTAGLPTEDPYFKLTGKVTTAYYSYEIKQFGKRNVYYEYFVEGPRVPGLYNIFNCAAIPLYQISKAEYQDYPGGVGYYKITLKNGKSFFTSTNIPFLYRPPEKQYYLGLAGGVDPDKSSWFWFVIDDPRFKEPREISVAPTSIRILEIY